MALGRVRTGDLVAVLIRPKQWGQQKPPPGAAVDYGHPLARGLVMAHLLNGGLTSFDSVSGRLLSATTIPPKVDQRGMRLDTQGMGLSVTAYSRPQPPLTVAMSAIALGTPTNGAGYFGMVPDNAGGGPFATAFLDNNNGPVRFGFSDGGSFVNIVDTVSAPTTVGVPFMAVGVHRRALGVEIWRNAVLGNSSATARGDVTYNATAQLFVGIPTGAPTTRNPTSIVQWGYIWNRALTASDIQWLYAEPYAMFVQPKKYVHVPGGGAVATKTYTLMPDMRNRSLPILARSRRRP